MQPFKLPDFYLPWPARLNPKLNVARQHSKEWALDMGILGQRRNKDSPQIWDEHGFDRHDYALFCAYIHPETPSPELNLMTDWNVWAFYVDDLFLEIYKKPKDHAGARKYLDRVLLFMPVDLEPMPSPANPTERALADLWRRTAPSKSKAWRRRIIESTSKLLEESIGELDDMSRYRLTNPIEYIEMRRRVGGALWSADLVEHASFVEIPERIVNTRPMRVLKETFADAVHLRNDIFSYQREVLKEGELTNGVLVIERFLAVDTQQAVNLVNDLIDSRLDQFDHTVETDLDVLFEEYALDAQEQAQVFTYVRGLRDWQAGGHEWHIQTSRYLNPGIGRNPIAGGFTPGPNGLGTSNAQISRGGYRLKRMKSDPHVPYQRVGPTKLPAFYMPFTTQISPFREVAHQCGKAWGYEMGIIGRQNADAAVFIWNEQWFEAVYLASFCAMAYPDATQAQLELAVCWLVWATYIDDYFPEMYGRTHDLINAKKCCARLSAFMPLDDVFYTPEPLVPIERGLADLWAKTTASLSVDARRVFRQAIESMVENWVWEVDNRIQNRIPEMVDFLEMRRKTSGSEFMLVFIRSVQRENIPADVYETRIMQELNLAAGDQVMLVNDMASYQREIEFEGDIHNIVLVIQNFLGCDRDSAVEFANKLTTDRTLQFEHIVANQLPALFEKLGLDDAVQKQVLGHVESLKRLMCASVYWHIHTGRFDEAVLLRMVGIGKLPLGFSGFGASAVRIKRVLPQGE